MGGKFGGGGLSIRSLCGLRSERFEKPPEEKLTNSNIGWGGATEKIKTLRLEEKKEGGVKKR